MALSARMLALIQKIDAAEVAHFASLRASAKTQSDAHAKTLAKKRVNLRLARATRARLAKTKRKPQAPPR